MLPVVDKPLIQYAVEEAVTAGVKDLIFVTGRSKRSIEDHFDKSVELEAELESRGKTGLLEAVRGILPPDVTCLYIRQAEPLGLGHAVLCARPAVGDEPFAVILPDDLIDDGDRGCLSQMAEAFERDAHSLVAVEQVSRENTERYGVVSLRDGAAEGPVCPMTGIVEKPRPELAPSNLGVVGRYVLVPEIFDVLESTPRGAGGEIQLTDAIARIVETGRVSAFRFAGKRYDCGSKVGFLEATVELALKHPEVKDDFAAYLDARAR
jgi:UTP--glucose-1-phosphate uridylyltransferase